MNDERQGPGDNPQDPNYSMQDHKSDVYDSGLEPKGNERRRDQTTRDVPLKTDDGVDPSIVDALRSELNATRRALKSERGRASELQEILDGRGELVGYEAPSEPDTNDLSRERNTTRRAEPNNQELTQSLARLTQAVDQLMKDREQTSRNLEQITQVLDRLTQTGPPPPPTAQPGTPPPIEGPTNPFTAFGPAATGMVTTTQPSDQPGTGSGLRPGTAEQTPGQNGTTPLTLAHATPTDESQKIWWRRARLTAGVLIALVIVFSFFLPFILPISDQGVVNAQLHWVEAPIAGNVKPQGIKLGQIVDNDQPMGEVVNNRIDTSRMNDLRAAEREANRRVERLQAELADLERERVRLADALRRIKADLLSRLDIREQQERASQATLRLQENDLRAELTRLAQSAEDRADGSISLVSRNELDRLERELEIVQSQQDIIDADLSLIRQERGTVSAGLFTDMDAPVEYLRAQEVDDRISALHREITSQQRVAEDLIVQIREEDDRLAQLRRAELLAPIAGPVWQIKVTPDAYVSQNERMIAIADASTTAIDAFFHQRHDDSISVGDRALVHLIGEDQTVVGRVSLKHNRDEDRDNDDEFAYDIQGIDDRHMRVTIRFDQEIPGRIGQRARVMITGDNPGLLKRMAMAAYSFLSF